MPPRCSLLAFALVFAFVFALVFWSFPQVHLLDAMDRADPAVAGHLLRLLPACLDDDEDDVRQSVLGLLGDLAKHAPLALADASAMGAGPRDPAAVAASAAAAAGALLPLAYESLTLHRGRKVCSNAAWAVGELTVAFGDGVVGPHAHAIAARLATVLREVSGGARARLQRTQKTRFLPDPSSPDVTLAIDKVHVRQIPQMIPHSPWLTHRTTCTPTCSRTWPSQWGGWPASAHRGSLR